MADNNLNGTNGIPDSSNELERLRALAQQLTEENEQLKEELRSTKQDREDFLAALRIYDPTGIYTEEDLAEFKKTAVSFDQVLREMDEIAKEAKK